MGKTTRTATEGFRETFKRIERRLRALERRMPAYIVFKGPRTDEPDGLGDRVRVGLLSDGTYGIERWTSTGTRQTPTWS